MSESNKNHVMFDRYRVRLKLTRPMLATNPCDPNIHDVHVLDTQRKLIMEKSGDINAQVNKYLDQIPISKEKGQEELDRLLDKLETLIGYKLSPEERTQAIAGELESLKKTFKEMDLRGVTVFFWDKATQRPCIGDHMIYGFLKGSAEAICKTVEEKTRATILKSLTYTVSTINQHVRVEERFIPFDIDIDRYEGGQPKYLQRSLRAMTPQGPRVSLAKSEVVNEGANLKFTLKVMKNSPLKQEHLEMMFSYGEMTGLGQWRNAGNGMFVYELEKL